MNAGRRWLKVQLKDLLAERHRNERSIVQCDGDEWRMVAPDPRVVWSERKVSQ